MQALVKGSWRRGGGGAHISQHPSLDGAALEEKVVTWLGDRRSQCGQGCRTDLWARDKASTGTKPRRGSAQLHSPPAPWPPLDGVHLQSEGPKSLWHRHSCHPGLGWRVGAESQPVLDVTNSYFTISENRMCLTLDWGSALWKCRISALPMPTC